MVHCVFPCVCMVQSQYNRNRSPHNFFDVNLRQHIDRTIASWYHYCHTQEDDYHETI